MENINKKPDYYTSENKLMIKGKINEILSTIPSEDFKTNDKQILRTAILAEIDAINLYEQMAEVAEKKEVKETLLDIAKEEKTHIGEFQALLINIDPEYKKELDNGKDETIKEGKIIGHSETGDYFKEIKKAQSCDDLERIKKYYAQDWFNRLPDDQQNKVAKAMMNKVNQLIGGSSRPFPTKKSNIKEVIIKTMRLLSEDTGLANTDDNPTTLTYNIKAKGQKAGEILIQTQHKDLGKDTMEILDLKLDKNHSDVETATGGVHALWSQHPNAMRIVVCPADNTLAFWNKLGFNRLNNEYLILDRNHNLSQV